MKYKIISLALLTATSLGAKAESIDQLSSEEITKIETQFMSLPEPAYHYEFAMNIYSLSYTELPKLTSVECEESAVAEVQPDAADLNPKDYCYIRLSRAFGWYADPELVLTYYAFLKKAAVESGNISPEDFLVLRMQILKPLRTGLE